MSLSAELTDLSITLGEVKALDGVNLTVEPGQFLSLLGPSGSGKTTTLNVLAGFLRPDLGSVKLGGRDVTNLSPQDRNLGVVFQGYALFPNMTVAENVAFPLRMRKMPRRQRAARVAEALELVDLGALASRATSTLSGGQRQRVALARAIVFEPRMLLLDEPLAALDKRLRDAMQYELKRLQERMGVTAIAVTHDQVEAFTMSDVVAVMRDGHIEQVAEPRELYLRPATTFVATFLGDVNLLPVERGQIAGFGSLGRAVSGQAVIRPEHLLLANGSQPAQRSLAAAAQVEHVAFQGPSQRARLRLSAAPATELTVVRQLAAAGEPLSVGDQVEVMLDPAAVHVIEGTSPGSAATRPTDPSVGRSVMLSSSDR